MNIDYSLFFYVTIILPIILTLSMLLVTSLINKSQLKKKVVYFKDKINIKFFSSLEKEDYNSFQKYEIWHFTEHIGFSI
ncbi:MAG: hypothetical protein ACRC7N_10065 [Clostridium sp.]